MARKGNAYYHTGSGADRRWRPLGSDLATAKRRWADLEYVATVRSVADAVDYYVAEKMARRAANTVRQYKWCATIVRREWGDVACDALRAPQIVEYRDRRGTSPVVANTLISLLRVSYATAIERGWCELNPAASVVFCQVDRRERYMTDAEFVAIRAAAPAWLATAMDVSYLTALRPCDVLGLRWDQVGERLQVQPQKTKRDGVTLAYTITPELRVVLEAARRRPIVGLYVVATDKGRPITARRLDEVFAGIVKALGFQNCQFRDIRAKAATDAEAMGQDAQALLHHASRGMTRRYLKLGEVRATEPLRRKL